ncbi:hypothetical protein BABINDRAFT_158985 [Babjeviella inositovora NRRL Y-12698]|uniref:Coatomer subunit delta n=1 Tax=Babjeviella inositovora NRRL Y-12698 TaxID=984486 RepID=A0A1E3QXI5_9ASCO|nr:uncharacterized protein BABINDRAFT_158985 [Babjeviella inositovora NRRL Y-12698]ODQ82378.1 hypothetical protein BABINDRAFT_158985 [Babjeviella inositovora NRRL Y-12698]
MEELYIVLITTRLSNILQDIETLHLFAQTVAALVRQIDEREIFENAFEILSAFDELVTLGHKENLSLSQVRTFLEMDSHEEKIQEIIERNKELEATEERKRRAKEIQRKELARRNEHAQFGAAANNTYSTYQAPQYTPPPLTYSQAPSSSLAKPHAPRGKGLQLGKKTKPVSEFAQPLLEVAQPAPAQAPAPVQDSPVPAKSHNNGILVTINEKVSAQITRDGSVVNSEAKGDLQLRICDAALAHSRLVLRADGAAHGVQYKTHPNVDRAAFTGSGVIALKDTTKPFPANDQALGVLRWRAVGKADDATLLPLTVSCWLAPSEVSGAIDVTLEYELNGGFQGVLRDIAFVVPLATHNVKLRTEHDGLAYDVSENGVLFSLTEITPEDPQGAFEFTIEAADDDELFPMELAFNVEMDGCFGRVAVQDIVRADADEESLPFDLESNIAAEAFYVV